MNTDLMNLPDANALPVDEVPDVNVEPQDGVIDPLPAEGNPASVVAEEKEQVAPQLSARDQMMAEITANAKAQRDEEMGVNSDDEPNSQVAQPAADDLIAGTDVLDLAQFGNRPIALKVNGQDVQVPAQQLVRNAQVLLSADQRMQAAVDKERSLIELEASLQAKQTQSTPSANVATQTGVTEQEVDIASISDLLLDGDTDAANAAIEQLVAKQVQTIAGRGNAIPNMEELTAQVQTQLREQEAGVIVKRDFADVVGDPVLSGLYAQKYHALTHVDDPVERATLAASSVRDWRNSLIPASTQQTTTDARTQAKANAASHAAPGGAAARNSAPTPKAPPTRTDVVAQMAAARGQSL